MGFTLQKQGWLDHSKALVIEQKKSPHVHMGD